MNRFLRYSVALFLGACSVPNFAIAPEEDAGLVDLCGAQIANGKLCGGQCAACENGQACDTVADCASGVCEENVCAPAATCTDKKINGAETDTDCGGNCPACALALHCTRSSDCASTLCDDGVCTAMPTCSDKMSNGLETDIDCGGEVCEDCPLDAHCTRAGDCGSGLCKAGLCAVPSADPACNDSTKNAAETDTDCGGETCDPCEVDKRCAVGADCVTLVCSTVCQPASCKDNVRNGSETDKDCGGSCTSCDVGLVCKAGADCKSLSCSNGLCLATSCTDKIKNGTETGLDCGGGGGCGVCPTGGGCGSASDCESLVCATNKTCSAATCTDGVKNGTESVADCGRGCKGCVKGQFCNTAADCASATCTQSTCVPSAPSGGVLDPTTWVATASHVGNSPPQQAIDGTLSWRWSTGTAQTPGMWFALDMRQTQYIFSIDLDTEGAVNDAPALFDVYVSTTGIYPSTPALKSVVGQGTTHIDFGKATPARYVRFVLTAPKNNWWSIRELYVAD